MWKAWEGRQVEGREEGGEARHVSKTSTIRLDKADQAAPVRATGSKCSTSRPHDISNWYGVLAHPCDIRKG